VITRRVERVRGLMSSQGLDALLVRSTDRYLNEYVPAGESTRQWLTGFTGSMGDALLLRDRAWLALDGRYHQQGAQETAGTPFEVEQVPLGTALKSALFRLLRRAAEEAPGTEPFRVGYEPDRFSVKDLEDLERALKGLDRQLELVGTVPSLIERARDEAGESPPLEARPVRGVDSAAVGATVADKVALAAQALEQAGVQAYLVLRLDELAWASNLRGDDFPYQATFRAEGLLLPDRLVVCAAPGAVDQALVDERSPALEVTAETLADVLARLLPADARVGCDAAGTTVAAVEALRAAGAEPVPLASPLVELKAIKNPAELGAMRRAFRRADEVVEAAQAFVAGRLAEGRRVTEADLADEVERLFRAAGATGLSFKTIAGAGANGAIIHYSTPDPEREIGAGEMVLLDTGAYFAEGYATDLTRTFLAGPRDLVQRGNDEQRRLFTHVLRAAIAGMSARLPESARGDQLDAIVRAPLWAAGLDYGHGTGHGVGVNVHEYPPRVSPTARQPLRAGQVFSIEPGVYLPGVGGVRIENLVTLVPAQGAPGFLDVEPLTFAPFDERLIEAALLSDQEQAWLQMYSAARERADRLAASPG
jgi:Xaa-Pro aminopeptidase